MSWTNQVSQYQEGKTNLDLLEQETVSGSGISWIIHKSAPHGQSSPQTDNHVNIPSLSFYRPDALPAAKPTASKH